MKERFKKPLSSQMGFTLIELAIVLIIIGIIIAAILKGQDLIENSRHKKFVQDVKQMEITLWQHQDREKKWPGETSGDGIIDGNVLTDITNAKYVNAPTNPRVYSSHTFYVYAGNDNGDTTKKQRRNIIVVCANSDCTSTFNDDDLPYLKVLDSTLDDSVDGTTGKVRGVAGTTLVTATSSLWLANLSGTIGSSYWTAWSSSTKALVYWFDRKRTEDSSMIP